MTDLHANYDLLTRIEREALDEAIHALMRDMKAQGFPMSGDDRAERATDALAVCIIAARSPEAKARIEADAEAAAQNAAEAEGWTGPHHDRFGCRYFENHGDRYRTGSDKPGTWACATWRQLCSAFDIDIITTDGDHHE